MIKLGICNELIEGWDFDRVCRAVSELGYDGLEIAPFTLAPLITDLEQERRRAASWGRWSRTRGSEQTIGLHWLLAKTEGLASDHRPIDPGVRPRRPASIWSRSPRPPTIWAVRSWCSAHPSSAACYPACHMNRRPVTATEIFKRIMPAIGALGVDLCFEPLAPDDTDFVNTCAQGMELIRRVDHPHFKLHMDVKAQSSERGVTVPELIRRHARVAGHFSSRSGREPAGNNT